MTDAPRSRHIRFKATRVLGVVVLLALGGVVVIWRSHTLKLRPPSAPLAQSHVEPTPPPTVPPPSVELLQRYFREVAPGYACLPPLPPGVRYHVAVGAVDRSSYQEWGMLRLLGLSGAQLHSYLRTEPPDGERFELELPCGMTHHEHLLLPNHGEEGAIFAAHVASFFDDLPDVLVLLHDVRPEAWHAQCSVLLRRMQAVHMGLQPNAPPALRKFAAGHRTLNGHSNTQTDACCGPYFARILDREPRPYTPGWSDNPTCPWAQIGATPDRRALCQVRGNTDPDANFTVLATDTPHWFFDREAILATYEADPALGVPVTWRPVAPTPPRPPPAGLEAASQPARSALGVTAASMVNVYDELFPWVEADMPHFGAWGLTKFWRWLLYWHNLTDRSGPRAPRSHERHKNFCCFQFSIPAADMRRAPKSFWEDLAWFTMHKAWTPEQRFKHNIGRLFEFHFFEALDLQYTTLQDGMDYLRADQALGPQFRYPTCQTDAVSASLYV